MVNIINIVCNVMATALSLLLQLINLIASIMFIQNEFHVYLKKKFNDF